MRAYGKHIYKYIHVYIYIYTHTHIHIIGLYARRKQLMENFVPIMAGSFISTVVGIFAVAGLNRIINPAHELKVCVCMYACMHVCT